MSVDQFLLSSATTDLNYPEIRPTLDLNFARVKALDPRITFTRSSGGSYVGADGLIKYAGVNEARFDHNPVTGESLGLLIEESRANSWINSGQNNVTGWNTGGVNLSFDNTVTAPDGTTNTIKCVETNTFTSGKNINQSISVTSGTSYTFSIFAKQPENSPLRYFSILFWDTGFTTFQIVTFDPKNGTVLFNQSGNTTFVEKYPNGWWRFGVTATATATATVPFNIRFTNSISSSPSGFGGPYGNYTGDGSSFLYFYGPQVEAGAFPTSYIPTQASSRTRAADNASITGTNFSSWYNQNEGTIYTNNRIPYTPNPNVSLYFLIFGINAGNRNSIEQTTVNGLTYITQNSGLIQYWSTSGSGVLPANTNRKTTYAYASSNNTTILSGTSNQTYNFGQRSSVDVYKSMTTLYIGRFSNSLFFLNGTIAKFTYYPKALPPSQLQALTR